MAKIGSILLNWPYIISNNYYNSCYTIKWYSNNEDEIDELKVMGEIICQYNIDRGNVKTEILSQDFEKPDSMNIVIDNKIIVGFVREFQFSESGDHKLRFVFYNQKVNLDNMFKDIKSLVSVEMNSTKSLEITSMQSTK